MPKIIFPTQDIINKAIEKLREDMQNRPFFSKNNAFDFSDLLVLDEEKNATLHYSAIAWEKQRSLVESFDTEIAWYGVIHRSENNPACFIVDDILVYPQKVSGAYVDMDTEKCGQWLFGIPDEVCHSMRLQGHSHVRMSTDPSDTDLKHQYSTATEMAEAPVNKYYVSLITNKLGATNVRVFDFERNLFYDYGEVDVFYEGHDLTEFIKEAKLIAPSSTTYKKKDNKKNNNYSLAYEYPLDEFDTREGWPA